MNANAMNAVFERCIADYHIDDNVDTPIRNPYPEGSFDAELYAKNWIDTVQWHLEDIIRRPDTNNLVTFNRQGLRARRVLNHRQNIRIGDYDIGRH